MKRFIAGFLIAIGGLIAWLFAGPEAEHEAMKKAHEDEKLKDRGCDPE